MKHSFITKKGKDAKYDAMYFLKKFETIPNKKWCMADFQDGDRFCALGHCGCQDDYYTSEGKALDKLLLDYLDIGAIDINDCESEHVKNLGKTPKERLMNALMLINAGVKL